MPKKNPISTLRRKYHALFMMLMIALLMWVGYELLIYMRPSFLFPKWKDYEVKGIDVSRYQKKINWNRVERENIAFCFIKATEGNHLVDKTFKTNWSEIRGTDILRGAYHYYRPNVSWESQADLFIRTVDIQKGDLPPVLDIEELHPDGPEPLISDIKKWLSKIEMHYGIKPIVYSSNNYYNKYLIDRFRSHNLWIACYRNSPPDPEDGAHWEFWQYSDQGRVPGIPAKVDMNCFFGTRAQLDKLTKK